MTSIFGNNGLYSNVVDFVTNSVRATIVNLPRFGDVQESLVDTTNVADSTVYYPSSTGLSTLGTNESLSVTGKFICGAGSIALTCEGTNDEDTASGDWHDITPLLKLQDNSVANASVVATAATVKFALFMPEKIPYASIRWKVVITGTSATNTVIIKQLKKAK